MEAEKLRAILASPPLKLEKTAQRINVPLPVAKQLRIQGMNLIMGKCVLCSAQAFMGICRDCRAGDPLNDPSNYDENSVLGFTKEGIPVLRVTRERFLRQIDPGGVLIRRDCESCGHLFSQSVETVVKNLLNFGRPYIAKMCRRCNLKRKRMKSSPPEVLDRKEEVPKASVYAFKPFAGSTVLEKLREELGGNRKSSKRAKKVKK